MKKTLAFFLSALMVLSAVVLVTVSAVSPVTVSAGVIEVEEGTKYVDIPVTISDIPSEGLSSFSFNLKSEGLTITNIESMLDGISPIGSFKDSDKNGATFMWNDFMSGLRETTQVCIYTLRLPTNATAGDEFQVVITPTSSGSFSSVDTDPSSGERYVLGANAVNGRIKVIEKDNSVTVSAPTLEVDVGTKSVNVPIRISGISSLFGLGSFKFNTMIKGFSATKASYGPLPGEVRLDSLELSATRGVDLFWLAPTGDGIFDATVVVTYTFDIPKSARSGDVYPIVITPDSDPNNFLSVDFGSGSTGPIPLGAVCVNGKIIMTGESDVPEQPDPVKLSAPEIHVDLGTKSVSIPVVAGDIPREGLAGCSFNLKAEGLNISDISSTLEGDVAVSDSFDDSASKGADFLWRSTEGVRVTTEVCTYTVDIPSTAKAGDVFPIIITPDENPESFPSVDPDPESGTRYALGAVAENGCIVIDGPAEYDGPPVVLEAPEITVYENTDTVEVPITVKNIPDIGLRTGKFMTIIEGLTIIDASVSDSIKGKGSYSFEPTLDNGGSDSVEMVWVNNTQNAFFSDTLVVTYTVAIPSSARPGDVYTVSIIPSFDRGNFVAGDKYNTAIGATAINGKIVLKEHDHVITSISEKAATCTQDGSHACYQCSVCKKYFSDQNAQNEIDESQAVIPQLGHNWNEWSATVPATCLEEGSAIRTCQNDSTHTETKVLPITDHRFAHFEREEATCDQSGTMEYWRCEDCRKYFAFLDSITVPENPETNGEVVVKTPSYSVSPDTTELEIPVMISGIGPGKLTSCYFKVEITGGAVITSAKENSKLTGITVVDDIVTDEYKSSTKLVWVTIDKKGALSEETTMLTLKVSLPSGVKPGDEFEIRVIPSTEYNNFMPANSSTGIGAVGVSGNIVITEKTAIDESETVIPALGHSIELVEAKDATPEADGYVEHYKCSRCGKLFTDAEGKNECTAESLAVKYGLIGDANGDNRVNAKDIIVVMKHMLGQTPNPFFKHLADVNEDNNVNAKDIILIMKIMLGAK